MVIFSSFIITKNDEWGKEVIKAQVPNENKILVNS